MQIATADGVLYGNYVYFSNVSSNSLFRINIASEQIELLGFFPDEKIEAGFLHKRCFIYGEKLFFLPAHSRNIAIYDISTGLFSRIPFENDIEGEAILDAVKIESKIIIFPRNERCIPISLDMETLEFVEISGFDTWLDRYVSHCNPEKFYRVSSNGKCIYFGLSETDLIVVWNYSTNTFRTYKTGMEKIINVLPVEGGCFFTVREKYGVGKLKIDDGSIEFFDINCDRVIDGNTYGCLFQFNDGVGAAPAYGDYIHCFNNGCCFYKYKTSDDIKDKYKFYRYISVGSNIWLLPLVTGEIYVLKNDLTVHRISLTADDDIQLLYNRALTEEVFNENLIIGENKEINLSDFVGYISNK
ncbi:MAG: hypothetical protein J6P79_00510 [Pseudobutyrivibrio sp.]|nr:hypothetical protein [Pseudobutyrivibrio sp.]